MNDELHTTLFIVHRSSVIVRIECAPMANIKKVGVLGCGLMGSGIAQTAAQAGYPTVVREVEQRFLDKGLSAIQKSLGKFVEKGKRWGIRRLVESATYES